jgi:hypothetical protein
MFSWLRTVDDDNILKQKAQIKLIKNDKLGAEIAQSVQRLATC